jgi:hypothetical protein
MEVAARITERFISEKRSLLVVFPEVATPSKEQTAAALSTAVVQPAFRASNPNGPVYVRCTIHESNQVAIRFMASRCQEQLQEIAGLLGVTLVREEL